MDAPDWLPLTAAQRGLFFAHHLAPDVPSGTTAEVVELAGPVDADRLRTALAAAHAEFEQLRVELRVAATGPEQRVRPAGTLGSTPGAAIIPGAAGTDARPRLPVVPVPDDAAADAWLRADLARPLDLLGGETTRSALLALPDGRCWWYHAAHHVVLDGYGAQQLLRRVAALYDGAAADPVVPLAEVVAAEPVPDERSAAFWDERLRAVDGLSSLAGRAAAPSGAPLRHAVDLDDDAQRAVAAGARALGVGLPDLLASAVATYVARATGAASARVGVTLMNRSVAGRGTLVSARTVCTATNVLPLAVPAAGTLGDALDAAAAEQAALRDQAFVRQEDLVRRLARTAPGAQLFGTQVNLVPLELELTFGAVRGRVRNLVAGPVEDLTVCLRGVPGRGRAVRLEVDANPALYTPDEARRHGERLVRWLRTVATASRTDRVDDLPLLDDAERELVVTTFNATDHPHEPATLSARFVAQARATPDAVALVHGTTTRTYAEVLAAARSVAGGLHARGVRAGDVVGVALPRSTTLLEVVHGIVLLGAVYLPLDPDLPAARVDAMLADAEAVTVVTPDDVPHGRGADVPEPGATSAPASASSAGGVDDPAYLLFTSGSTGRPKGVLVAHRAIDNRLAWMQHHLPLRPGDRVLHKTPISFDVSVWELFWPLQVGATLVVADPGAHRDPRALADLVVTAGVGTLHFVPSMLAALLADRRASARLAEGAVTQLVTSGEALTPDLAARARAVLGVAPVNLYGPTEAAIDVTCWDCDGVEDEVPIGRPVWNTSCYVLDARRRPLPVGVAGELWLGGVQLADGYVGRPDLTAERFVPDPFRPGGRMYRTGDRAAWREDGALRYVGRVDDQVKVRGQRVELGEIEAAAAAAGAAAAVVAGLVGDDLVVWFVPPAGTTAGSTGAGARQVEEALRRSATERLPASFLPHRWVAVDTVPVTASGKADRRALARDAPPAVGSGGPVADGTAALEGPAGLLEQRVCGAFATVLGVPRTSPLDDFFALGGDSLRVLRLVALLSDDLGVDVGLADVFAHPTPRTLAAALGSRPESRAGGGVDGTAEVLTLRVGGDRAPLFLLPPAGGLGWCYVGLLRDLPPDLPVHTVQAPGLTAGRPEPVDDLSTLAARQLAAIRTVVGDGPFHVAGWSLGGMAAHEVAALARRAGQQVGAVVLLDAYPADQWSHLAPPTPHELLVGVLRLGGVDLDDNTGTGDAVTLDLDGVLARLRTSGSAVGSLPDPVLQGCVASVAEAARLVRTSAHSHLPGGATVVVAGAPRPEHWLDAAGWEPYVAQDVEVVELAATHGELVRGAVAGQVAAVISDRMARAGW